MTNPELVARQQELHIQGAEFLNELLCDLDARKLVQNQFDALRRTRFYQLTSVVADMVDPKDRVLGKDPQSIIPHAFLNGVLLAAAVVKKYIPKDFLKWDDYEFPYERADNDKGQQEYFVAEALMEQGQRSYQNMGPYQLVVDKVIDDVCPPVDAQIYVKAGFGFVFSMVDQYVEEKRQIDQSRFAASIDQFDFEKDLEAGFREMLDS